MREEVRLQIVTDSGMDLSLPEAETPEQVVYVVRHKITLGGETYESGTDLTPDQLYHMLATSPAMPTTSQPAPGEFAELFRRLAVSDADILCINMSSGLSGTMNAARVGAEMTPEANVTVVDSKTLSGVVGWQVAAAARAIKAGWPVERIVALIDRVGAVSETSFTLDDLKYLIHGGRISHMKGLIASVLNLRPMIGVSKTSGAYIQLGQARTFDHAMRGLADLMLKRHPRGTHLRTQVMHAANPEGAAKLRAGVDQLFQCSWLPTGIISPVLGAHTGPTLVGVAYSATADYPEIP